MKKMLSLIFIMTSILCFFSCSKDDESIKTSDGGSAGGGSVVEKEYVTKIEIENGTLLNKDIYNFGTLGIKYEPEYLDAPICYWSSSDPTVVSVDKYTGRYSVLSYGRCVITATTIIGPDSALQELTAECRFIIEGVEVDSVEFDVTEQVMEVGEDFILTPFITPSNATIKKLVWESSDSTVASVNGEGLVCAIGEGECNIYARSNNDKVAECRVTVLPASIKHIEFIDKIRFMPGDSLKVGFSVTPSYAKITDVKWEMEDETVASVTDDGLVVCNNVGSTILRLTLNNEHSVVCEVEGCAIDELVSLQFGSSAVMSVGGYVTGNIELNMVNNSMHNIVAKNIQIIDGSTGNVGSTIHLSNIISGGTKIGYNIAIRVAVYKPIFRFNYIYDGKEYSAVNQYDN